jgi:hypothetical protein
MSSRFKDKDDDGLGAPIDFWNNNSSRAGARPTNSPLQPIYAGTDGFYRQPPAPIPEHARIPDTRPAPTLVPDTSVHDPRGMEATETLAPTNLIREGGYGNLGSPPTPITGPIETPNTTENRGIPLRETSRERRERENPFLKLNKLSPPGPIAANSSSYYVKRKNGEWDLTDSAKEAAREAEHSSSWPWGNPFSRTAELPAPVTQKQQRSKSCLIKFWSLSALGTIAVILIIVLPVVLRK